MSICRALEHFLKKSGRAEKHKVIRHDHVSATRQIDADVLALGNELPRPELAAVAVVRLALVERSGIVAIVARRVGRLGVVGESHLAGLLLGGGLCRLALMMGLV